MMNRECKIHHQSPATASVQPFLRWSGGKRRLLPELVSWSPSKFLKYYEPFVGAGGLYFKLAPGKAAISDKNAHLIRSYLAIQQDHEAVFHLLKSIPLSQDAYLRLRSLDPREMSNAEAAARFIFIMKSCFNGVYRENQKGQFNTPWGGRVFRLPDLADLQAISGRLANTRIELSDFQNSLQNVVADDFIYLDPPYPQVRYRGEFGQRFCSNDLERLARECLRLDRIGARVMLSYVETPLLRKRLKQWHFVELSTHRSVSSNAVFRGLAPEVLVMNYSDSGK